MNEKQMKKLKQDAQETIDNINPDKLTKDSYVLLGASMAILDHDKQQETQMPIETQTNALNGNFESLDPIPESNINENIDDLRYLVVDFWNSYNIFENTRTEENKTIMIKKLENLLNVFENAIVELRHKVQQPESINLIKRFYSNLRNKI